MIPYPDGRAPAGPGGLPAPGPDAHAHSARVVVQLGAAIDAAGGAVDFARYLDLVLYAPGLGYYSAGATRFGGAGDFVTAPELGPAFAGSLAAVARRLAAELPALTILEFGAGSGALAAELLRALADAPPARYLILEVSADLRARQRERLAAEVPALLPRVEWLDAPPATPVDGLVVANEVVDALPWHACGLAGGLLRERCVTRSGDGFGWVERPAPAHLAAAAAAAGIDAGALPDGYRFELRPRAAGFIGTLADCLGRGLALVVDYGGSRRELYHPDRAAGTLRCHYRHHAHDDPFLWPGLQDITAWVDFSALADAARGAGLAVAAYGTQAHFLLATGILERVRADADAAGRARAAHEVGRLLLPGELGERFKVLVLGRAAPAWASGLVMRDLRPAL
jgi:SAM-dependent MidA family methyltransferase